MTTNHSLPYKIGRTLIAVALLMVGAMGGAAGEGWLMGISLKKVTAASEDRIAGVIKLKEIQAAYWGKDVQAESHDGLTYVSVAGAPDLELSETEKLLLTWSTEDRAAGLIKDINPDSSEAPSPRVEALDRAINADLEAGRTPMSMYLPSLVPVLSLTASGGWANTPRLVVDLDKASYRQTNDEISRAVLEAEVAGVSQCLLTLGIQDGCGGFLWHQALSASTHADNPFRLTSKNALSPKVAGQR